MEEDEEYCCCCDIAPLLGTMALGAPLPPRSSNMSSSLRSQSDSLNGELLGCDAVRLPAMFTLLSSLPHSLTH